MDGWIHAGNHEATQFVESRVLMQYVMCADGDTLQAHPHHSLLHQCEFTGIFIQVYLWVQVKVT